MTEREIEMTTYDNDEWNPMSLIKAEIKIPLEEWSFDTEPHMRTLIPLRYLEFIPPSGSKTTWKKQQTLIPLFLILQRPLLEDHSYNSTLLTGNTADYTVMHHHSRSFVIAQTSYLCSMQRESSVISLKWLYTVDFLLHTATVETKQLRCD